MKSISIIKWLLPSAILLINSNCGKNPVSGSSVNNKSDVVASASQGMWSGALAVGKRADNRLFVFAIGADNNLYCRLQNSDLSWPTSWTNLGGPVTKADIIVATQKGGRLCVFANNSSPGRIQYRRLSSPTGTTWDSWKTFSSGGDFQVGNYPDSSLAVFIVQNNNICCCKETSPGSNSWGTSFNPIRPESISTYFGIAVGRNSGGNLEIFFSDGPMSVKHVWQDLNGNWNNAYSSIATDIQVYSRIQVAKAGDGNLVIFTRTNGASLAYSYQSAGGPGGWTTMTILQAGGAGIPYIGTFTIGTNSDNRLEVFYINSSYLMSHTWQASASANATWSATSNIAATPTFFGAVAAGKPGTAAGLEAFCQDNSNRVNYSYFNGSVWTAFAALANQ